MFWLRNKKNDFKLCALIQRSGYPHKSSFTPVSAQCLVINMTPADLDLHHHFQKMVLNFEKVMSLQMCLSIRLYMVSNIISFTA